MPRGRGASRYGPGGGRDWGERPSVDGPTPLLRQGGYPGHEVLAVDVVHEDAAALQALHHHMVEGIRGASKRAWRGMIERTLPEVYR